jgi:hypothetical protein
MKVVPATVNKHMNFDGFHEISFTPFPSEEGRKRKKGRKEGWKGNK